MPGANQPSCLVSPQSHTKRYRSVVEFKKAPTYRNNTVDLGSATKVEYLGTAKNGRVCIPKINPTVTRTCSVIAAPGSYELHHDYTGCDVSDGLEEIL